MNNHKIDELENLLSLRNKYIYDSKTKNNEIADLEWEIAEKTKDRDSLRSAETILLIKIKELEEKILNFNKE
jgi:hypothetical protein